jgi:hypothetical protein
VTLRDEIVNAPPVELWPERTVRSREVPADVRQAFGIDGHASGA